MKKIWRKIKNEWKEYNDGEIFVRDLTKNDNHPPNPETLKRLNELAKDTYASPSIYQMLNKRLHDLGYLAHIEKALIVVEYLLKHCDTRFINFMKKQTDYFKHLTAFTFNVVIDANNSVEKGENVRRRANRIHLLLTNEKELEKRRCEAQGISYASKKNPPDENNDDSNKHKSKNSLHRSSKSRINNTKHIHVEENKDKIFHDGNDDENEKTRQQPQPSKKTQISVDLFADFIHIEDNCIENKNNAISKQWTTHFAPKDGNQQFEFENETTSKGNDNAKPDEKNNVEKEDPEEWLTQLMKSENLLESPTQKTHKSEGKTLSQMAIDNHSKNNQFRTVSLPTQNPYTTFVPPIVPQTSMNTVRLVQQPYFSSNYDNDIFDMFANKHSNSQKTNDNNDNYKTFTYGQSMQLVPAHYSFY